MPQKVKGFFPQWIKNYYHLFNAFLAAFFYGFPAQKLINIGVTGTDGKTTTCYYIYEILKAAGKKVSLITSIGVKIGDQDFSTGLHTTTPNPWELQKIISEVEKQGPDHLVLEVTSHAIDQHRIYGIPFEVGVLTNITPEHLDYHKSFQNYENTKRRFLRRCKKQVDLTQNETVSSLKDRFLDLPVRLLGDYNHLNALAAAGAANALGISRAVIYQGIENLKTVLGRMQVVYDQGFKVIIDFAHTPNALEQALKESSKIKNQKSKLIVVFGCAGERDHLKRSEMGEIASQLADLVVLTAEDPRSEDVDDIIEQISKGCRAVGAVESQDYFRIPDRQEAINFAVGQAQSGDVIMICGKGHEQSMCFGKTEYPWSDHEAVKKALLTRLRPSTALGATAG